MAEKPPLCRLPLTIFWEARTRVQSLAASCKLGTPPRLICHRLNCTLSLRVEDPTMEGLAERQGGGCSPTSSPPSPFCNDITRLPWGLPMRSAPSRNLALRQELNYFFPNTLSSLTIFSLESRSLLGPWNSGYEQDYECTFLLLQPRDGENETNVSLMYKYPTYVHTVKWTFLFWPKNPQIFVKTLTD